MLIKTNKNNAGKKFERLFKKRKSDLWTIRSNWPADLGDLAGHNTVVKGRRERLELATFFLMLLFNSFTAQQP